MAKIQSFFVFVAMAKGEERIMMAQNTEGVYVPLAYTSLSDIEATNAKALVEELVEKHKLTFELRQYQLQGVVETFEPMASPLTM